MLELSVADHSVSPPRVTVPRDYNAAHDLIERNLRAGRSAKTAFIDDAGLVHLRRPGARGWTRFAHGITGLGLRMEDRVLVCLLDTIDFPTAFLGCIKAGVVPIPVNTLLTAADYQFLLRDSRARALVVSSALPASSRALARPAAAARPRDRFRRRARGARPAVVAARRVARRLPAGRHHRRRRRASGSTRRARPARPRARCTCTPPDPDRRALREARPRHPRRTTWCSPRRSCSSPTAWATRSRSRWRSAPPPS